MSVLFPAPIDDFEKAIIDFGVEAACEYFGHREDSEFTEELKQIFKLKYPNTFKNM